MRAAALVDQPDQLAMARRQGLHGIPQLCEFVSAVVLDVHLPDLDGFEVCRLLRERPSTWDLPVIQFSELTFDDADARAAQDCGANALIGAPLDPAELARKLDRLLVERVLLASARGRSEDAVPGVRSGHGTQSVIDQMTRGEKKAQGR